MKRKGNVEAVNRKIEKNGGLAISYGNVAIKTNLIDYRKGTQLLKNEVPITHIHQCHVLDYEHQIISVVISHCHYSLRMGEAHTVKYDYRSLQKHILDKFIHGKPTILSDIPQVVYKKDIHSTATFAAIRAKVKPQVSFIVVIVSTLLVFSNINIHYHNPIMSLLGYAK